MQRSINPRSTIYSDRLPQLRQSTRTGGRHTRLHNPSELHEIRNAVRHHERGCRHGFIRFLTYGIAFLVGVAFINVLNTLSDTANEWKRQQHQIPVAPKNLFLTPLIEGGNFSEARTLSRVHLFPEVESYSGFFSVDESCKSHLFFWFFPAASGNKSAPLLLWHGGGPGTTSLLALFQGTGPITLDNEGNTWVYSNSSWSQSRSVLYLDSPVGAGFSYTEKGDLCYAFSSDDVADAVINALRQFYQLFPEYQPNDFYICSSSYGGKFAPNIAWRIDDDNKIDHMYGNASSINLKGIVSISGFSDPINQIDYGEFYHTLGIIDDADLEYFKSQQSLAKAYLKVHGVYGAYVLIDPLVIGGLHGETSYLRNITGIEYTYNFVKDLSHPGMHAFTHRHEKFLNRADVQAAIHVDAKTIGRNFSTGSNVVYTNLLAELYKSITPRLQELLNSGLKCLFTSGQLDLVVPHTTVSKFLSELKWNGSAVYKNATNMLWKHNEQTVGYVRSANNLKYVLFRNAGHHPFVDQPELIRDLVLTFTS